MTFYKKALLYFLALHCRWFNSVLSLILSYFFLLLWSKFVVSVWCLKPVRWCTTGAYRGLWNESLLTSPALPWSLRLLLFSLTGNDGWQPPGSQSLIMCLHQDSMGSTVGASELIYSLFLFDKMLASLPTCNKTYLLTICSSTTENLSGSVRFN